MELADEISGVDDDEDAAAKRFIRRLWIAAGVCEVVYLTMLVWDQMDDARKAILRAKVRRQIERVLKPCTDCAKRRRQGNRLAWEAGQYLETQAAGEAASE
jgi:hypothetical protein